MLFQDKSLILQFVGPKREKYWQEFKKFIGTGSVSFATTWHWPAFIFTYWWFLYRKMYIWAFVLFLLQFVPIPHLFLPKAIACGLFAYYLYFKHTLQKIAEIKHNLKYTDDIKLGVLDDATARAGGVHQWVMIVGAIIWTVLVISLIVVALTATLHTGGSVGVRYLSYFVNI